MNTAPIAAFEAISSDKAQSIVEYALNGAEDGEIYLQSSTAEGIVLDDGKIKSASFDITRGFGLRAVCGENTTYVHGNEISEVSLRDAARFTAEAVTLGQKGKLQLAPEFNSRKLYQANDPVSALGAAEKIALLLAIDEYARSKDSAISQVTASISTSYSEIRIVKCGGFDITDIRPLIRLNISVIAQKGGKRETGNHGYGGRMHLAEIIAEAKWKGAVDKAVKQALTNLSAQNAPAGEMEVVLGSGWPGILLHEAVGHGLEGDFNRKETSVFSGKIGEKVASDCVTVIDDGTLPELRGSLNFDDEGTPTARNVLIENGVLKGYMQDRLNARLSGVAPTGNGRRQSYAHAPMPRMTNTFMLAGKYAPEEIIQSVKKGIYAPEFTGGQVDIVSGKFVFSSAEAYLIEDGKITAPIKGATLIGAGIDIMSKISMAGNDLALDPGIGTCGKEGQQVPVGVGQPTLKIDSITVGGSGR